MDGTVDARKGLSLLKILIMRINNSFLLGLAAGACLGYYFASGEEERDEIIGNVKSGATKVKDVVGEGIERGKKLVADMKEKRSSDQA